MNQVFSFKRFGLLVIKHWAENRKRYVLSVLALMGLLVMWFLFVILTNRYRPMANGMQQVTFFYSLFIVGTIYASQFFNELGSKPKGINYLLLPASTFEKFLCGLLYTVIFFFVVFTAVFYAVDALMVAAANAAHPSYNSHFGSRKEGIANIFHSDEFSKDTNINFYFFMTFLAVQSAYLLGSVYFEKYSFIKTLISQFIILLIFFFFVYFFTELLMPNGSYKEFSAYRIFINGEPDHWVQLPAWTGRVIRFLLMYTVGPLLWVVTYHRLKEKEV